MAEPTTSSKKETPKNEFVPFEQRESQNISMRPFLYEAAKFFIVTKLSALAGYFIGKKLKWRTVEFGILKTNNGATLGGLAGATYEGYHHWRKTEKQRLGIDNISKDLKTAVGPEHIEKEAAQEQALLDDLKKLEKLQSRPVSHSDSVTARRDAVTEQPLAK